MSAPLHVNDGSTAAPRLLFYGNAWAMGELPRQPAERNWTFEEVADRLQQAGFHGIQSGDAGHIRAIRSRGLRYAASGRANNEMEIRERIQKASDNGADCTTLHIGWGVESDAEIDRLIVAVLDASALCNLPAYIETHRATIAQDAYRIGQFITRNPDVRFNGDFSHLYCGGEFPYRGFEANLPCLQPILERVCFFHGRISDGESMQIDVGDGRTHKHAANFRRLWQIGMHDWLARAKPGDILPFAPELGPPSSGYSITYASSDGRRIEISDRWEQTLVLKRLAEEAWALAQK